MRKYSKEKMERMPSLNDPKLIETKESVSKESVWKGKTSTGLNWNMMLTSSENIMQNTRITYALRKVAHAY